MSSSSSASPQPQRPIQPLSVGNVVSAGFRLYSTHLKQYLGISLQASLWVLLPLMLLVGPMFYAADQGRAATGMMLLVLMVGGVGYLYCFGRYLANSGLISRLAFHDLINQPESVTAAQKVTTSRLWSFVGSAVLVGLVLFVTYLIGAIVIAIPSGVILASSVSRIGVIRTGVPSMSTAIGVTLFLLLGFGLLVLVISWLYARFFIAEVPIAVESGVTASQSLSRSWKLTEKNGWRIVLISFVAFLITIPLYIPIQLFSGLVNRTLRVFLPYPSAGYQVVAFIFSMILGFLSGIILMPFWQSIKAVIYYDLRGRREGLGLSLRDR